ncbi:2-alkenal reductase (nadp(+)-dependent) [Nicotiana attenuata]|uniref:2-alkenal reductase (Nadp(+)-dependent) n=1 Tax=Nicotiana attenuata TaxID=49451 RepID=A0A314L064_NICAT|nr:2-alkenal reductase (nadp(+)-dependent) [Nicotiana attenuata]
MEGKGTLRNKQVVLKQYVKEFPTEADFYVNPNSRIIPSIPDGTKAVLLKNLYLAVDADLRRRLSNSEDYYSEEDQHADNIQLQLHPIKRGSVISGYGVAKVFKSTNPNFREGDYVWGVTGWEEYTLIKDDPQFLRKINRFDDTVLKLSYYTGLLGIGGYEAYLGISYVAEPKQRAVCVYLSCSRRCWSTCWTICQISEWLLRGWKCKHR